MSPYTPPRVTLLPAIGPDLSPKHGVERENPRNRAIWCCFAKFEFSQIYFTQSRLSRYLGKTPKKHEVSDARP